MGMSMGIVVVPSPSWSTILPAFQHTTSVGYSSSSSSSYNKYSHFSPLVPRCRVGPALKLSASVSSSPLPAVITAPDDLVSSILDKVIQTDRGVLLTRDEHKAVGEIATQLQNYCVDAPVKCPLIFGEWDVVYCSNPTSPGGGYRSAFGRLIFNTKEMIQGVEAPDIIRNKVSFSAFGFLDGEVSLKGKLIALDERWIQVIFEAPQLKVGGLEFQYGGQSEVKLQITYIDEKIRLGVGSRVKRQQSSRPADFSFSLNRVKDPSKAIGDSNTRMCRIVESWFEIFSSIREICNLVFVSFVSILLIRCKCRLTFY